MSTIFLIRHGKASFLTEDYDRLSEPGRAQSRELGQWLARRQPQIDAVWVGPRRRHRETWEEAAEAALEAGVRWPDPCFEDALDEHHGELLLKAVLPSLLETDELVRRSAEALGEGGPEQGRHFQRLFEHVTARWARGGLSAEGVESWSAFRMRVDLGMKHIKGSTARGQRVLVFTSAGTIGAAAASVLEAPDVKALEIGFMLYNTSLSEIVFSPTRASLASFNRTPHLRDPEMLSFR